MSKYSNSIIIGGPIAVGKSTLVGSLPFHPVQELDVNDELQKILLQKMYLGDIIAGQLFQLDMILTRQEKYKKLANKKEMHAFDRSIFEDYIFAEQLLKQQKHIWNYYKAIWQNLVEEFINEIGKPKIYILLTCSWEVFKERMLSRGRKSEIKKMKENEEWFKYIVINYEIIMIEMFKKYDIFYEIVDTNNMNALEILDYVKKILSKKGIK